MKQAVISVNTPWKSDLEEAISGVAPMTHLKQLAGGDIQQESVKQTPSVSFAMRIDSKICLTSDTWGFIP